ncbi:MAG: type IV pilus assembly protein PilM [Planctomycetota bacterium]
MVKSNEAWGIEVGSFALKAIKLARHGGEVHVEDFAIQRFKQVLTTPDLNVEEQVRLALDQFMQSHEVGKAPVVVSVPGNLAFARFAKLPPVEPKKIPDIVRFEAVQQIPFPIEEVEWDYQVFQQEDSPDVEVGIFAMTKERVLNYLSNFRAQELRVDALTLSPVAVYNSFAYEMAEQSGDDEGVMLMDIGTVSTDVIIAEQGGIWLRTLPLGGNNFTEALVKQFKISFPKAEKLKREASTSKYAKQIFQAMKGVYADLVQEVQRSLGYYQSLNRDSNVTKIVGLGSTFKLPGLAKFLKSNLQIDVSRPDQFERISVDGKRAAEFASHVVNMAPAYGLALQGLGMESVSANLLPAAQLAAKQWRRKQPWILAAAGCMAAAAGLTVFSTHSTYSSFEEEFAQTETRVDGVINIAQRKQSELGRIEEADRRTEIDNIRRTLDYRDLWPRLIEDIGTAFAAVNPPPATLIPEPNAGDLPPREQRSRLYIESVNVEYVPIVDAAQTPVPTQIAELLGSRNNSEFFFAENVQPPSFIVTVTGTTPYRSAPQMLNTQFLAWFEKPENQQDRPYVFRRLNPSITKMTQNDTLGAAAPGMPSGAGFNGMPGSGMPGAMPGARRMPGAMPGAMPGGMPRGMGQPGMRGATANVNLPTFTPSELITPSAVQQEDPGKDWDFEVRFRVELRPPQDTRALIASVAPETPTPEDAATSDPAAAPMTPPAAEPAASRDPSNPQPEARS